MNPFLKKSALALGACLALASVEAATTTVVSFEPGLLNTDNAAWAPMLTDQDELVQNGVGITVLNNNNADEEPSGGLSGTIINGTEIVASCAGLICPTNNSSSFLMGMNDAVFAIYAANDTDKISLNSLKLSFIGAGGQAISATPAVVEIGGYIGSSYQYVRANLSSSGGVSFGTLNLAGTALATQQFDFIYIFTYACDATGSCTSRGTDGNQFAIDDLNVTLSAPVPEPAQWALLPAGLMALAGIARRRRAAA